MNRNLLTAAVAATTLLLPLTGHAQTVFTDNADSSAYAAGYAGQNGGSGFGAFNVVSVNGNNTAPYSGTFVGNSTSSENGSGNINSPTRAFGFYANGDPTAAVTITRSFSTGLKNVGDSFSLDFITGYNDAGTAGVSLSGDTGDFRYTAGGTGFTFNGTSTGQGYNNGALHLTYTVTAPGQYSLSSTGAVTYSGVGTFSGTLSGFSVFQTNSGGGDGAHDGYFNNLRLSLAPAPEPSGVASLVIGAAVLGGAFVARRRRATN